jgi:hypothetical protein
MPGSQRPRSSSSILGNGAMDRYWTVSSLRVRLRSVPGCTALFAIKLLICLGKIFLWFL